MRTRRLASSGCEDESATAAPPRAAAALREALERAAEGEIIESIESVVKRSQR